jgi:Zinc knuckle
VLAQAEIIEISENVAHRRDNRVGTSSSCRDISFMPGFPIPCIHPSQANLRSLRSMTFESSRRRHRDSRPPPSASQTQVSIRSTRSQRSRSARPIRLDHAERVSRAAGLSQVKSEPQSRPPTAPPVLSEKEKAELVGKCYLCKEPGHMARNCPQGNKVKSNTGKPL